MATKAVKKVAPAKAHQHAQNRTIGTLRGLAEAGQGVRRVNGYRVDPRILQIEEGFNVRFQNNPELRPHIDSIKESIRMFITQDGKDPDNRICHGGLQGVIPALLVRVTEDGQIFLVDGHCRTTAIRELIAEGFDIQDVDVEPTKEDEFGRKALIFRSSQGLNLSLMEKAVLFTEMADGMGMSFPQISRAIGGALTPQRIEQLVVLGRAPAKVGELVASRQVTGDSAMEIVRKNRDNPEEAVRILEEMVASKEKGSRPVGKGQTRASIPPKVQTNFFNALSMETKLLSKRLKELEKTEGWQDEMVEVSLPAGLVKQLLEQQAKATAKEKSAEAAETK